MKYERAKLLEELKQNICEVTFTKVNGETRIMRCTLDPGHIPQPVDARHLDEQHQRPENLDIIACWDLQASGWRSFRVENVNYVQQVDTL